MNLNAADQKLWDDMGAAVPRFTTIPTDGAQHSLPQTEVVSKALQTPLMPWQRWLARIASERDVNNPNRYRYRIVVVTVPRQSGKTTAMRVVLTERAMMNRNRKAFYTAQTGKDASARWLDLVSKIEESPMRNHVHKRMAAGSQSLTFPNGSTISPFPPTPKSLHGYTPHDVMLDEIFAWDSIQGNDLMGAIKPAQITLPDRQLWLVSTMGNAQSEFLNEWLAIGRQSLNDPATQVALIDFGLADGLDAFDPANWDCHPALGHTISKDDLAEAADAHTPGEFERAYMNRPTVSSETFVPLTTWDALHNPAQSPAPWSRVAVGYDVSHSGDSAAVVGAWYDDTGKIQLKVIRSAPGATWLPDYYETVLKDAKPRALGADSVGETRVISDELRFKHRTIKLTELTPRDYSTACIAFKNHILNGTLAHDASPALRSAIAAAVTRPLGEGWAFSGSKSPESIAELKAAVVAVKMLESQKKVSKPKVTVFA